MAFHSDHQIYDALPIASDALDKGGVELLRVGVVDEEIFITARRVLPKPSHWGLVLADVTRRLASLYAVDGDFTEAKVSAAIAGAFARSLRGTGAGGTRPYSRAKPQVKPRIKPSTKAAARARVARAKP